MMSADRKSESDSFFALAQSSSSFSARCSDAFASLGTLEKKHETFEDSRTGSKRAEQSLLMKSDPTEDSDLRLADAERNSDRLHHRNHWGRGQTRSDYSDHGKVSHHRFNNKRDGDGFRRPSGRPPRQLPYTVPDYKKHPDKWTCYSLEDVDNMDMSERSNQKVAFEFLAERKKAREIERGAGKEEEKINIGEAACSKGLISFSRPKRSSSNPSVKKDTVVDANCDSALGNLSADDKEHFTAEGNLSFEEEGDLPPSLDAQSLSEENSVAPETLSFNFKARKTVRRNIRHKESDD